MQIHLDMSTFVLISAQVAAPSSPYPMPPQFDPAPKEVVSFIRKYNTNLGGYLDSGTSSLVVRPIDLNDDEHPEIIVEARGQVCGAANCPAWVLSKSGGDYELLLDIYAEQSIQVLPSKTNGYADLLVAMHGSAFEYTEVLYKFAGAGYGSARCTDVSYQYADADGVFREHKKPQRTECRQYAK